MNVRRLCWLEARNANYRHVLLGVGILAFVYTQTPVLEFVGRDVPPSIRRFYLFFLGFTAVYLFVFFLGLTPVLREKAGNVYDRVFAMPVAPWRVFFAKIAGVSTVSFSLGAGTVLAVVFAAGGGFEFWVVAATLLSLAIVAVGLAGTMTAVVLHFESPRLVFFGGMIVLGGLTQLPRYLVEWNLSPDLAVAGTIGVVVVGAALGFGTLTRVDAETVVLE